MRKAAKPKRLQGEYHEAQPYFDFSTAWSCDWSEIEYYPITPLSIVSDDVWTIPIEWCQPNARLPSLRRIDFKRALPEGAQESAALGLIRRLKRLVILDRFQTLRDGRRRAMSPPSPYTWVMRSQQYLRAARYSIEHFNPQSEGSRCPDGATVFGSLTVDQFLELKLACPGWAVGSIARLNALYAAELFDDWPSADVGKHVCEPRASSKANEPFSDLAFSEIVGAAIWLNGIQSDVLEVYLSTRDIVRAADGRQCHKSTLVYRKERVQTWASDILKAGTQFRYWVELPGESNQARRYSAWPLETVLSLKTLLARCQTANAIIVLASTGMRIGELAALGPDSVVQQQGRWYLAGSSFKDTDVIVGNERSWPLPRAAVAALEAQLQLAQALGKEGDFWVPLGGARNVRGIAALQGLLKNFGRGVGLRDERSLADIDGEVTPHRFRYSAARYVALAMTGASQILFDVLGHDDVEVTLGYAMQDRELHEDINKIRSEVKAIRAKEVFELADENSGAAAAIVKRAKADMLARSGKEELDTDDINEGAIILGDAEVVKPGVLCTAQPLERGACSSALGIRDHAACTPTCMHRLEMAAYKQDRRRKIDYLLPKAVTTELGHRAFYQNQIIANLQADPSLMDELENDSRLRAALAGCDSHTFEKICPDVRDRLAQLISDAK